MDDALLGIVLGRLEKDPLADEATDLLLAAFDRCAVTGPPASSSGGRSSGWASSSCCRV